MRRLLLLVGAIVFVDTMFFAALTPLLPHYADDLGPVLGGIASLVGTAAAFGGVAVLAGAIAVFAALTPAPGPREWQPLSDLFRAFGDRRVLTAGWFVVLPGLLFGTLSVLGPLRLS